MANGRTAMDARSLPTLGGRGAHATLSTQVEALETYQRFRSTLIDDRGAIAAVAERVPEHRLLLHVGAALDPSMAREAKAWMRREPRYRWLGSLPHGRTLEWIARSHVLVVS